MFVSKNTTQDFGTEVRHTIILWVELAKVTNLHLQQTFAIESAKVAKIRKPVEMCLFYFVPTGNHEPTAEEIFLGAYDVCNFGNLADKSVFTTKCTDTPLWCGQNTGALSN